MPEENNQEISSIEDIKTLASIGNDMEEKSRQEQNKVEDGRRVLENEKRDANLELQASENWNQFTDNTEEILSNVKSSAEEALQDIEEKELVEENVFLEEPDEENVKDVEEEDPLLRFSEDISRLYNDFKKSIPDSLGELGEKAPDSTAFGEEVLKIIEFMDSLKFAENALQACRRASLELPDEVKDALIRIVEDSEKMRIMGQKRLENSDFRERKIKEIESNAKRNLIPMERTIGRDPSRRVNKVEKLKGIISDTDAKSSVEQIKKEIEEAPINQVVNKMGVMGATEEEINHARSRINQAVEEERDKINSTSPSSYTTPVS